MIDAPFGSSRPLVGERARAWAVLLVLIPFAARAEEKKKVNGPAIELGKRLFGDNRFTNPACNTPASCDSCHRPESARGGRRAYSDSQRYSLIPTHVGGSRKLSTLRNTPGLMDLGSHVRFNHDGRTGSLEETVLAEVTSVHYGWSPREREDALDEIHFVLLNDEGQDPTLEGTYVEQFRRAYTIDLNAMRRENVVGRMVKCLADYVRALRSPRTSAYDAFLAMNRLPSGPGEGESPQAYTDSLLVRVTRLEERRALKLHPDFSAQAYAGFKIFMRRSGETGVGNCAACHTPPRFSDGGFHNTGVAQMEFDATQGSGAFLQLAVPESPETIRPVEKFGPKIEKGQQVHADLGYWNYVRPDPSAADGSFLTRALGAFKTPSLRNLVYSDPYMHNGLYRTLEDAVSQKVRASGFARSAALRSPAAPLLKMRMTTAEVAPVAAFLRALNDLPAE